METRVIRVRYTMAPGGPLREGSTTEALFVATLDAGTIVVWINFHNILFGRVPSREGGAAALDFVAQSLEVS